MLLRPSRAARGATRPIGPFQINRESPQSLGLQWWWPLCTPAYRDRMFGVTPQAGSAPWAGDGGLSSAATFDGSSNALVLPMDFSPYSALVFTWWMFWTTNANDDALAFEYTANSASNTGGLIVDPNESSTSEFVLGVRDGANGWLDSFTRPSAAAWHQYVWLADRATPANAVWVDGASVALTTAFHSLAGGTNFASSLLYAMSRGNASLFGTGRMADLRVYTVATRATDRFAWSLFDPQTRWDLYWVPSSRVFFDIGSGVAPRRFYLV